MNLCKLVTMDSQTNLKQRGPHEDTPQNLAVASSSPQLVGALVSWCAEVFLDGGRMAWVFGDPMWHWSVPLSAMPRRLPPNTQGSVVTEIAGIQQGRNDMP